MTDYETPRKLILTKPRSSETAEMGMTRERCFDTPSVLKSILDYVACTGWHRCSTAYIIEHSESNPDNIVFVTHGGCGILEIGSVEYTPLRWFPHTLRRSIIPIPRAASGNFTGCMCAA